MVADNVTAWLATPSAKQAGHAAFLSSCYFHCGSHPTFGIAKDGQSGMTGAEAFSSWMIDPKSHLWDTPGAWNSTAASTCGPENVPGWEKRLEEGGLQNNRPATWSVDGRLRAQEGQAPTGGWVSTIAAATAIATTATATATASATPNNYSQWALAACKTLQETWFNTTSGTWNGHNGQDETGAWTQIGWWNAANSLEATVNCAILARGTQLREPLERGAATGQVQLVPPGTDAIIDLFFRAQNVTGIAGSRSYDDSGWVTLAWARAFEHTGNAAFLARAELFWQQVQSEGWDDECGGGLYWAGDGPQGNRYKNAISNELFLMSSATLYRLTGNVTYKEWAIKEWRWFSSSGMMVDGIVNGGLTSNCKNDGSEGYTYNQGVILGGLSLLANITGDRSLLTVAEDIIEAVLASDVYVYDDGILREPCEEKEKGRRRNDNDNDSSSNGGSKRDSSSTATCDDDQLQFKGVFTRYLNIFLEHAPEDKRASAAYQRYRAFLALNAKAVWSRDRDESDGTFGLRWEGPLSRNHTRGAILQTSALDCLTAAAAASLAHGGSVGANRQ